MNGIRFGRMIDVGGRSLHLVCAGRGRPPVVFESAIAGSSLSWARVLPEVAAFTRACAYDRAGLGWSEARDPRRHPAGLATITGDMDRLLTNAAVERPVVLVGHSFGAFLACAFAATHPLDVAGLVLVDPPCEWHAMTRHRKRLLWGGIQMSRLGALLARLGVVGASLALLTGGAPGAARGIARLFGPTTSRTLERLVGEVRKLPDDTHPILRAHWSNPKAFRAMAGYMRAMPETAAFVAGLTSLGDIPISILSSGDQPAAVLEAQRQLMRLSPRVTLTIAERCAHWIQFDDPALVVRAIRSVVTQVRATGASAG